MICGQQLVPGKSILLVKQGPFGDSSDFEVQKYGPAGWVKVTWQDPILHEKTVDLGSKPGVPYSGMG